MSTAEHDEQPPTAAVGDSDETAAGPCADETDIVPSVAESSLDLAWSYDENDDAGRSSWGAAAERASVIVLGAAAVAVVIGLATWFAFYLFDQNRPMRAPEAKTPSTVASGPTAAPPPPSTVTVTAAPPPTVPVEASPPAPRHDDGAPPPARGTDVFTICPDGHEGVVGGHTSCEFASSVRQSFYASGMSSTVFAYSPVTGDGYEMTCVGRYPAYFSDGSTKISTRCYGGENAEVVIW